MQKTKPEGTVKKLPPNAGKGRKPGVPNKATGAAKQAIAMLADGMTPELQDWLRMSAYGVAELWEMWQPEKDGDEPPPGAEVSHRGKVALVRMRDEQGKGRCCTLSDIVAGQLPEGAIVRWIVRPDPGGSTDTMLRALEYHIPKLSRAELTGGGGAPLIPAVIKITGVKAPRRE